MRLAVLTILIVFVCSVEAFPQDTPSLHKSFELYIMPLSFIPYTPRLRVGAEYNYNQYGYSLDIGVGRYNLHQKNLESKSFTEDYSLIEFRPEFKIFIKNQEDIHFYAALELFTIYIHDNLEKGSFYSGNGAVYYESASVNRLTYGFHIKGGHKMIGFNHLLFDFYYGLGFMKDRIYYTDIVPSSQEYQGNFEDNSESALTYMFGQRRNYKNPNRKAKKFPLPPSLTLGVKIGFISGAK